MGAYRDISEFKPETPAGIDAELLLEIMDKRKGDNAPALARFLGKSRQNVYQALKGDHDFTLVQIRMIAERYEMTPQEVDDVFIRRKK